MISAKNITMKFDDFTALNHLNCEIPDSCIYGLVGSNGAGNRKTHPENLRDQMGQ